MIGKKREESEHGEGDVFEVIARKLQSGKSVDEIVKELMKMGFAKENVEGVVQEIANYLKESGRGERKTPRRTGD